MLLARGPTIDPWIKWVIFLVLVLVLFLSVLMFRAPSRSPQHFSPRAQRRCSPDGYGDPVVVQPKKLQSEIKASRSDVKFRQ